jgi:hypothetical protein
MHQQAPLPLAIICACLCATTAHGQSVGTPGLSASANETSLSAISRAAARAHGNLRLFHNARQPVIAPASATSQPQVWGVTRQAERVLLSPARVTVVEAAPAVPQSQQDATPVHAGNPAQQNLAGVTYDAYPLQAESHFGPPKPGDVVFRYQAPFCADTAAAFGGAASARSAFQDTPPFPGIEITDSGFYLATMTASQKSADMAMDPDRWVTAAQATQQAQLQGASEAEAQAAESCVSASLATMTQSLINVANDGGTAGLGAAATPAAVSRQSGQAVWMVQQMLRRIYMPMSLLLLLVGAVLTHVKMLVSSGVLRSECEGSSPFTPFFRSIIAVFLIPATQLIMSWAIDIGNSMTQPIAAMVNSTQLMNWASQQTFNAPPGNAMNQLLPPRTTAGASQSLSAMENSPVFPNPVVRGKVSGGPEEQSQVETQSRMTQLMQAGYNTMNFCLSAALMVLTQFQLAMMCYLLVLGPIAAAFFAWPDGLGSLFKNVFASWLDGLVNLALWRFWWCVVLLCMNVRIEWLKDMGQYAPNSSWETMMFTAFMVILVSVPFNPFTFQAGEMVAQMLQQAQQSAGGAHS